MKKVKIYFICHNVGLSDKIINIIFMIYIFEKLKFFFIIIIFFLSQIFLFYNKTRFIKDVLFIKGYKETNQIYNLNGNRNRVSNQMEQLNAGFLESNEYFYENFDPIIVLDYRVIIFYLCPWTQKVNEAITLAKNFNKKVLFDIDNLLFATKYTNNIPFIKSLSKEEKE